MDITNLNKLEIINCNDNYLSWFNFSTLNPDKLTYLNISDNNLNEQDLSVFSKLTKLEELWIGGNNKSHFDQNIYNNFFGSLKPLKNLVLLRMLHIDNTDINDGIEYLSENLKCVSYSIERRPKSKVKEISEQLKWIGKYFSGKQLNEWMKTGLQPEDYEFAFYLKQKGYLPNLTLNYGELKEEYNKSQGWLDRNYPRERREEISEICLNDPTLEGELDLNDFTYWGNVKIYVSYFVDENKLEIKVKDENVRIIKLINAQEWLDKNYPKNGVILIREARPFWNNEGKVRSEITRLYVNDKNLEGELDLSDFKNLSKLNCCGNKLTKLDISKNANLDWLLCYNNKLVSLDTSNNQKLVYLNCWNNQLRELNVISNTKLTILNCYNNRLTNLSYAGCENLKILNCYDNYLTSLDFSSLSVKQLTHLDVRNNNLSEEDCLVFSRMVNLERLNIGNTDRNKIRQDIYNRFFGSLAPLAKLTKLERLSIDNTDIDSGLEYLSNTLQELRCSDEERPGSKVKRIKEKLSPYNGYFLTWKSFQLQLQVQRFQKQQSLFTEQAENIRYLEIRIQELVSLIKTQKKGCLTFLRAFYQSKKRF